MGKKIRWFEEGWIGAAVLLSGKSLEIGEDDSLDTPEDFVIPDGVELKGFQLTILVPEDEPFLILQRNLAKNRGGYHPRLESFRNPILCNVDERAYRAHRMRHEIVVMRAGGDTWTLWHAKVPNRVDCWWLDDDGSLSLYQVGVVTHDNGQTFRLLGEKMWSGRLFRSREGEVVAKPHDLKQGPFSESRRTIFDHLEFAELLTETALDEWTGSDEELNPPLGLVPGEGFARVEWYIPFAGKNGQGIVLLHDGRAAWIHGENILDEPEENGIKRFRWNDLVSYEGEPESWGKKPGALPRLRGVRRVEE